MKLVNLDKEFRKIRDMVANVDFLDIALTEDFKKSFEEYTRTNPAGGYSGVRWAKFSTKIETSTGKSFTLPNFWFFIASELANYLEALEAHRSVFLDIFSGSDLKDTAEKLREGVSVQNNAKIKKYFTSNKLTDRELENFLQFVSSYNLWGGGKTIDRDDYYVSALMKAGGLLAETQGAIAEIANQLYNNKVLWDKLKQSLISTPALQGNKSNNTVNVVPKNILPKPFILLAGISGSGKTRFVRQQVNKKSDDEMPENYCLVPVRPDWHEPSDLLGYVSRIGGKGAEYVVTDVLKFMVKAWIAAMQSADKDVIKLKDISTIQPYWLCLDEMNLAPVEQYFADYLSLIETRKWEKGIYSCDALLKFDALKDVLSEEGLKKLEKDLGIEAPEYSGLREHFRNKGIPLPLNLIVAGTVNMDETTHGFSRKVIDRALTIDFGEFFPNDYQQFFDQPTHAKSFSFPVLSHATENDLASVTIDKKADGTSKSIAFLEAVNDVLRHTPFELAYRALNEMLLSVICFSPKNDKELQAVWDDFLMMKVLPRIDGDSEKLRAKTDKTSVDNVLVALEQILEKQLKDIWNDKRPDLLRENKDGAPLVIDTLSRKKLVWMKTRLDANGFTAFWP